MKRLLTALLCCLLLAGCSAGPVASEDQPDSAWALLDQSGCEFVYTDSLDTEDGTIAAGLAYEDGDWITVTALAPSGGETETTERPMYQADTGSEGIRVWYGVCGTAEHPFLMLRIDEDEPTCRALGIQGSDLTLELNDTGGDPLKWACTGLTGLPDENNCLTITLSDINTGKNNQAKEPYCAFSIDLTDALAGAGW